MHILTKLPGDFLAHTLLPITEVCRQFLSENPAMSADRHRS